MIDDADTYDFQSQCWRTAKKDHTCEECGRQIWPGERYQYTVQKFDGSLTAWKTCAHCEAAGSYLVKHCNGYLVGAIEEDLREHWDARVPDDRWFLGRALVGMKNHWTTGKGGLMRVPAPLAA